MIMDGFEFGYFTSIHINTINMYRYYNIVLLYKEISLKF